MNWLGKKSTVSLILRFEAKFSVFDSSRGIQSLHFGTKKAKRVSIIATTEEFYYIMNERFFE